jgi:hypothetical protein
MNIMMIATDMHATVLYDAFPSSSTWSFPHARWQCDRCCSTGSLTLFDLRVSWQTGTMFATTTMSGVGSPQIAVEYVKQEFNVKIELSRHLLTRAVG